MAPMAIIVAGTMSLPNVNRSESKTVLSAISVWHNEVLKMTIAKRNRRRFRYRKNFMFDNENLLMLVVWLCVVVF